LLLLLFSFIIFVQKNDPIESKISQFVLIQTASLLHIRKRVSFQSLFQEQNSRFTSSQSSIQAQVSANFNKPLAKIFHYKMNLHNTEKNDIESTAKKFISLKPKKIQWQNPIRQQPITIDTKTTINDQTSNQPIQTVIKRSPKTLFKSTTT